MVGVVHLQCPLTDTDFPRATLEDSEAIPVIYWERSFCIFTSSQTMKSDVKVKQRLFQVCNDPNILLPIYIFPGSVQDILQWNQSVKTQEDLGPRKQSTYSRAGVKERWDRNEDILGWGLKTRLYSDRSRRTERSKREVPRRTTKATTKSPAKERNRWITWCVWKLMLVDIWKFIGAFGKKKMDV